MPASIQVRLGFMLLPRLSPQKRRVVAPTAHPMGCWVETTMPMRRACSKLLG